MEQRFVARPHDGGSHPFDGPLPHPPMHTTCPATKHRTGSRNSDFTDIPTSSKRPSEFRSSQRFDVVSRGSREVVYERVERSHHNWPPSPRDSQAFTIEPAHSNRSRQGRQKHQKSFHAETESLLSGPSRARLSPSRSPTKKPLRHHADLIGIGEWCETGHQSQHSNSRRLPPRAPSPPVYDLDLPLSPQPDRLSTPDIGPLSMHYQFCSCCEDRHDRINETWHMTGRSKMDAQLAAAMKYIEAMKDSQRR